MIGRCKAKTKAGKRCSAPACQNGICALHGDPKRAAELGRKGGRRNRRFVPQASAEPASVPKTAEDVRDVLGQIIAETRDGRCDPRMATTIGYLGTSLLKAIEVADLEERIGRLERETNKNSSTTTEHPRQES